MKCWWKVMQEEGNMNSWGTLVFDFNNRYQWWVKYEVSAGIGHVDLLDQLLDRRKLGVLPQPEDLLVALPHVFVGLEGKEVLLQPHKRSVVLPLVVRSYWDTVRHLESIRVGRIVHKHHPWQIPIQNSQVFDVVSFINVVTVPSEESMPYELFFWVKVVDHCICIGLVAGSKDHQLELFWQFFKKLLGMRSDVDRSQHGMASRESDRDLHFMFFWEFLKTVNESFIKIQNYCYFSYNYDWCYL